MLLDRIKSLFGVKSTPKTKAKAKDTTYEGRVKRVIYKKGFGFIDSQELGKQIFVHFKDSKAKLRVGQKVRFKIQPSDKGPRAVEVEVI